MKVMVNRLVLCSLLVLMSQSCLHAQTECDELVCETCTPYSRFWASAEYLYWHTSGMSVPALVSASPVGTTQQDAGVLGLSSTTILFGNDDLTDQWRSGGRIGLGFWLDERRDYGLDFTFTGFGSPEESLFATSDQTAILARPFFNVETGLNDARLIGFPGTVAGEVFIDASTDYGVGEVLIRQAISHDPRTSAHVLCGYRFAQLDDTLFVEDFSESLSGIAAGSTLESFDQFESRNTFHGFEMGLIADLMIAYGWQLHFVGKVAFGETDSVTTITGQTTATTATGATNVTSGGLLTQASNLGRFESNSHGVIQDLTIGLRRQLRPGLSLHLSYGIHRWIDIQRAAEQIDLSVNPTQIPPGVLVGDASPAFPNRLSEFVAQGATIGIDYSW